MLDQPLFIVNHSRILLAVTVLVFCVMYVPQPLISVLSDRFGVDAAAVGLLVSVTLIPMAVAPLTYGYFLKRLSALLVLRWALVALGLSCVALAAIDAYTPFLVLRGIQGLIMPAILTALMAYLSAQQDSLGLKAIMARYVAATIVGGLLGRLVSGGISQWYDYHLTYWLLAVCLIGAAVLPWQRAPRRAMNATLPTRAGLLRAWSIQGNLWRFLAVSCLFAVFAGFLNFLPLRLTTLDGGIGPALIGLAYVGYLGGIATSLGGQRIARTVGGVDRTMQGAMVLVCLSILASIWLPVVGLFVMMWVFCLSMFLIHTLAVGEVNQAEPELRGVVNGLYVAHYYGGGVIGTWLPGYVYDAHGWTALMVTFALIGSAGVVCLVKAQGR